MKTVSGAFVILLSMSMLMLAVNFQQVKAEPGTWTVDDDAAADFSKIQDAINAASPGDTIYVHNGTYYENVVVNKTVSLFGENAKTTIVDGNETGDCVNVAARSVKISALTIRNGGSYASVRLLTWGNSILGNNLIDSWCGVWMEPYSDSNLIANNTITGNLNGIAGELWHSTKIIGNSIENNLMGLWIGPYSENNVISFNNIAGHTWEGLMMMQSSSNTFEGNNIVDNNQGGFSAGIVIGFRYYNSSVPSGNKFFHNNIANVGKQIELMGSEPIIWDDGYPSGGNYWSDYNGTDSYYGPYQNLTANDDVGDTPYVIDPQNIDRFPLMYPHNANPWDLTGPVTWVPDGKCDTRDIALTTNLFGALVDYGEYDRRADITGPKYLIPDGKIDIRDLALICKHFGETHNGEITLLDDRFDTGLDNWVYWGDPGYVLEWVSNAAKISGDHMWPPLVDCGMQKVVDLLTWGENGALLLSFDWRAASSYSSSCTTNARLWIQDADSNSSLLFLDLISGGTLDTGWQAYSSDISSYVTGHSNIRIILYLMDNYAANYDQTNFYDNIKLEVSGN